jgi:hypothetical protein
MFVPLIPQWSTYVVFDSLLVLSRGSTHANCQDCPWVTNLSLAPSIFYTPKTQDAIVVCTCSLFLAIHARATVGVAPSNVQEAQPTHGRLFLCWVQCLVLWCIRFREGPMVWACGTTTGFHPYANGRFWALVSMDGLQRWHRRLCLFTIFTMFNQYIPSDLIMYFSLSIIIDVFCILLTTPPLSYYLSFKTTTRSSKYSFNQSFFLKYK